jgi:hypothetical protein
VWPFSRMLPSVIAGPGGCLGFISSFLSGARYVRTSVFKPRWLQLRAIFLNSSRWPVQ